VFEEILRDEHYHVAWTAAMLERWRREGKAQEVKAALGAARTSRAMGAWKRAGLRSAAGFGRAVMLLCYVTVLLPFGLAARARAGRHAAGGWQAPKPAAGAGSLRSQA
jgi:hypothetical protein